MAVTEGFKDLVRDLLDGFGPVTIRNMFSGAGVYSAGVMFAILAEDSLYLKADEAFARDFENEGMRPFTYQPQGRTQVAMSYWEVPPRLLEDPEELVAWAQKAHRIACSRAPRRAKRRARNETNN